MTKVQKPRRGRSLRDDLAGCYVEDYNGDNLAIVLVSYFEDHIDRPLDDPNDEETGWGVWSIKKTEEALDHIAEQAAAWIEEGPKEQA